MNLRFFKFYFLYSQLLVANKVDLVHLRKVTEEQGRQLSQKLGLSYLETSAKDPPFQVDACFHEVVRIIRNYNANEHFDRKNQASRRKNCCVM